MNERRQRFLEVRKLALSSAILGLQDGQQLVPGTWGLRSEEDGEWPVSTPVWRYQEGEACCLLAPYVVHEIVTATGDNLSVLIAVLAKVHPASVRGILAGFDFRKLPMNKPRWYDSEDKMAYLAGWGIGQYAAELVGQGRGKPIMVTTDALEAVRERV